MLSLSKKLIIVIITISIPLFAYPQEGKVLNKILKSGELRIGTNSSQPPFTMKTKEGQLMGYEVDLAKLLTDALNLKLKFVEKKIQNFYQH